MSSALLALDEVTKDFTLSRSPFGRPRRVLHAVRGVSLEVAPGETLGIVGESGCGKSTLARLMLRLEVPTSGRVRFGGVDIARLSERELRPLRRDIQAVFQDPYGSLDPRMRARDIVAEPLSSFGVGAAEREARVLDALDTVGLAPEAAGRFPHAFSGGQRQRIGIARALVLRPKLIVCDEAVSALDVSVQAQILNLLGDIQQRYEVALVFISHNLAVVRHLARRVAVMYLGQVVELASEAELFERPLHPYTRALLAAVPRPDVDRQADKRAPKTVLEGEAPSPVAPPPGCAFRSRCPIAEPICEKPPELLERQDAHWTRCHLPQN